MPADRCQQIEDRIGEVNQLRADLLEQLRDSSLDQAGRAAVLRQLNDVNRQLVELNKELRACRDPGPPPPDPPPFASTLTGPLFLWTDNDDFPTPTVDVSTPLLFHLDSNRVTMPALSLDLGALTAETTGASGTWVRETGEMHLIVGFKLHIRRPISADAGVLFYLPGLTTEAATAGGISVQGDRLGGGGKLRLVGASKIESGNSFVDGTYVGVDLDGQLSPPPPRGTPPPA